MSLGERADLLASTGRRNGRWVCSTFEMAEDLADHLTLRDDGDEPQCPTLTPRAVHRIQCKHPMQQPCPAPMRRRDRGFLFLQPLLAQCGDDAPAQVAVGRQTAAIAHQMDMRERDQSGQLLQEFQRREANPCGAVRPVCRAAVAK